jgi:hypothetical protein
MRTTFVFGWSAPSTRSQSASVRCQAARTPSLGHARTLKTGEVVQAAALSRLARRIRDDTWWWQR